MSGLSAMHVLTLTGSGFRPALVRALFAFSAVCLVLALNAVARAQEVRMDWFPIRPLNFDVALRQQTFAPNDREVTVQAGLTVLHAGNLELRAIYQFFSVHTQDFKTDQHAVFLNPRWNNFIDILDFPRGKPLEGQIVATSSIGAPFAVLGRGPRRWSYLKSTAPVCIGPFRFEEDRLHPPWRCGEGIRVPWLRDLCHEC